MVPSPAKAELSCYRFGPFRLRPNSGVLYRGDELVQLTPKAFGVLLLLVENAGEVVQKQRILDTVWAGSFVEETSLTKNVSILRKILSDGFPEGESIRTISKRGYQLTIPVSAEFVEPEAPVLPRAASPPPPPVVPEPREVLPPVSPAVTVTPAPLPVAPAPKSSRRLWYLTAAVLVLAAVGIWNLRSRLAPRGPRSSVAVISFHDLSGKPENAWLSRAVSEMLTTELDADSKLRTLPGDVTAQIRSDLSLPDQNGFSAETLARIRRAAECDYVISGSYLSLDGNVRLDVRVQDTARPDTSAAMSFTGTEKKLPEVVSKAGAEIRARFGVPRLSVAQEAIAQYSLPSDPDARREYAQALEKLRAFDPAAARELLDRVVAAEPQFAEGHLQLSAALTQMGYELRARDEAHRAFDLSGQLPREERLAVEARYRETASEWDKAAEIYTSLWTFYPDNPEYGISLARVQTREGKAELSDRTLGKLKTAASPAVAASVALASAESASASGDLARATAEYSAAIESARKVGARLLEGRAEAGLALALEKAGHTAKSLEAWNESVRICTAVGDNGCVASSLNNAAIRLMDDDKLADASEALDRALQLARKTGNRGEEGRSLHIKGLLLTRQGSLKQAQQVLEQCLALSKEIADPRLTAVALHRLGDIATRTGDETSALKFYSEETEVARQIDNKNQLAQALDSVGRLKQRQGDLAGARRDLEEALRLKRQTGSDSAISTTLTYLSNLAKNQGDLDTARKLREEECRLADSTNRKTVVPRCRLALADIDLLRGKPADAEAIARPIADGAKSALIGAESYRILALARLAVSDNAGADTAIRAAQKWSAKNEDVQSAVSVTIAAARVDFALGRGKDTAILLRQAMEQARRSDTMSLILEARLASAEVALKNGDPSGRKQMTELIADSTQRGFGLYASRGQKLLSQVIP